MIDTSEILVSKEHIDPLRDQGFVIYKLGWITSVVDGKREAKMLWGNVKDKGLSQPEVESIVTEIVATEVEEINTEITNIINTTIPEAIKTAGGNNHESFLIENTVAPSIIVPSSWTVEKYNEQVGEFKAVVMVRDKSLNEITTLMNILSFDYSDPVKVIKENLVISSGAITLFCGVDNGTKKLYVELTGMAENAKRIHLCFERCVLGTRYMDAAAELGMTLEMSAFMQAYLNMQATANMAMNIQIGLTGLSNFIANMEIHLNAGAALSGYQNMSCSADMYLQAQAILTSFGEMRANLPLVLQAQAQLKGYQSLLPTFAMQFAATATLTLSASFTTIQNGLFYNFYALADSRNIMANGWRIATLSDWNTLISYAGGTSLAGGYLKDISTAFWNTPVAGAASYGFNLRGSGFRPPNADFRSIKVYGWYWTGSAYNSTDAYYVPVQYSQWSAAPSNIPKQYGFPTRGIKDTTILSHGQTGSYLGNDGKMYHTICVGTQEWIAYNLAETKYRNGDWIPGYNNGVLTTYTNAQWNALTSGALCVYLNSLSYL